MTGFPAGIKEASHLCSSSRKVSDKLSVANKLLLGTLRSLSFAMNLAWSPRRAASTRRMIFFHTGLAGFSSVASWCRWSILRNAVKIALSVGAPGRE